MNRSWRWNTGALTLLLVALMLAAPLFGSGAEGLDVARPAVKVTDSGYYPDSAREMGYTGKGVTIAIMDSGVDDDHPSLEGAFVGGVDFSLGQGTEGNPGDEDGHGTHVAGIALGRGGGDQDPDGVYSGMAPGASLVDVKVLTAIGATLNLVIADGIQWCIDHKDDNWSDDDPDNDGIDILSISIVGGNASAGNESLAMLIDQAVEAGIVVVVAAGNDGPDNDGFGDMPSADGAITVGALDDRGTVTRNDDVVAPYSSRGPRHDDGDNDPLDELKPDIVAPGDNITSAEGTLIFPPEDYIEGSGTSMSAPMVAGVIALMLEANPDLTPAQVKRILRETAEPRGEPCDPLIHPHYNTSYGFGMLDAHRALKAVENPVDLVVTQSRAIPQSPAEGDNVIIACTVTNNGELRSTGSLLTFQYEANFFLDTRIQSVELDPGESRGFSHEWESQDQAGPVTFSVLASTMEFNDTNSADNLQAVQITVRSRPDFQVERFELSEEESLKPTSVFYAYVQVRNNGETEGDCMVKVFFQDHMGYTEMDRKIVTVPAKGYKELDFQLNAPEEAVEDLQVSVVLESQHSLPELDTTDNEEVLEIEVEEPKVLDEEDGAMVVAGVCCVLILGVFMAMIVFDNARTNAQTTQEYQDNSDEDDDEDDYVDDEEMVYEPLFTKKKETKKKPEKKGSVKKEPWKPNDPEKFFKDFVKIVEKLRDNLDFREKAELEKGKFLGLYLKAAHSETTEQERQGFVAFVDQRLKEFLEPAEMLKALSNTEMKVYLSAVKYYAGTEDEESEDEEDEEGGTEKEAKEEKPEGPKDGDEEKPGEKTGSPKPLSKFVLAQKKQEKLDFTDEEFSKFFSAVDVLLGRMDETSKQQFRENERGMELYAKASTRHREMSWEERNEFLELFSELYGHLKGEDRAVFEAGEGYYLLKKFFLACEDHNEES